MWAVITEVLPASRDDASKAKRRALFANIDAGKVRAPPAEAIAGDAAAEGAARHTVVAGAAAAAEESKAGDGALTYNEIMAGMSALLNDEPRLQTPQAKQLLSEGFKLTVESAFLAAAAEQTKRREAQGKPPLEDAGGEKMIEAIEFRLMLAYLRSNLEIYAMFDRIDDAGADDGRISLEEFQEMVPTLKGWGVEITDVKAEFDKINTDGQGDIDFEEFKTWALKAQLDLEEDDE